MYAATMSPPAVYSERYVDPMVEHGSRTYGTFEHLVGLLSALDGGTGLLGLIGALIMWRVKAKEDGFLDDHGREAVNFQISLLMYAVGGAIAAGFFTIVTLGIGSLLVAFVAPMAALGLLALRLVGCIRGAMAANRGEYYRYPMCVRFLKGPADRV